MKALDEFNEYWEAEDIHYGSKEDIGNMIVASFNEGKEETQMVKAPLTPFGELRAALLAIALQCEMAGDETISGFNGMRIPVSDIAKCARQTLDKTSDL